MLLIRNYDLWCHLSDEDYAELKIEHHVMEVPKGEYIYFEAYNHNKIYFVKEGYIRIGHLDADGNEKISEIIQKGELFGQFTLEKSNLNGEFAQAYKQDVSLCAFYIEDFEKLLPLQADPTIKLHRSRINLASDTRIKPLFERAAEAKRYFAKTGIYQINHGMVIRRPIFERHPWAALNIYNAFAKARGDVIPARDTSLLRHFEPGLIGDDVRKALATDPMAYGVKGNRKVLETITQYVHEQGLSARRVALEEMFAPSTMDL